MINPIVGNMLSCPFCGHIVEIQRWKYNHKLDGFIYNFVCLHCGCSFKAGYCETEEEAIAKWNTRTERTCFIFPKPSDSDFVNDWHYLCSECGCEIDVYERNPNDSRVIISHARYCPNCGARVVEENGNEIYAKGGSQSPTSTDE